jgi:hypothetical protein
MMGCEVLFSAADAERVQQMIEDATGLPCACKRDLRCPLFGERVLEQPLPRARSGAVSGVA